MKKVFQTYTGAPGSDQPGNCWAACIATMLGVELEDIPDELRHVTDMEEAWKLYNEILRPYGFVSVYFDTRKWSKENHEYMWANIGDAPVIVTVPTAQDGDFAHAVVFRNGRLWHNPNPEFQHVEYDIMSILGYDLWLPISPHTTPHLKET